MLVTEAERQTHEGGTTTWGRHVAAILLTGWLQIRCGELCTADDMAAHAPGAILCPCQQHLPGRANLIPQHMGIYYLQVFYLLAGWHAGV